MTILSSPPIGIEGKLRGSDGPGDFLRGHQKFIENRNELDLESDLLLTAEELSALRAQEKTSRVRRSDTHVAHPNSEIPE